jgi:O-antigen ligase
VLDVRGRNVADAEDPHRTPEPPRRARALIRNLVILAIFGSTLLVPPFELGFNAAAVDVVLAALVFFGWRRLFRRGDSSRLLKQMAPWLYLYLFGQVLGLLGVGFAPWALAQISRNILPVIVFLVLLGVLQDRTSTHRVLVTTFVVVGLFVAVTVLGSRGQLRGEGFFGNPNYAAHFMACAVLMVPLLKVRTIARWLIVAALCAGIYRTGSFAGALILLSAGTAAAWRRAVLAPRSLRGILRTSVVVAVLLAGWIGYNQLDGAEVDVGSGVSTRRFERSSTTRTELWLVGINLWREHPLGVGPDGIRQREIQLLKSINEIHNDTLDTLVAGGIPAVVGMFGIVSVLWRNTIRGSRVRVALIALIASSVVRQTWNFRHMWLFLGVLLAIELAARRDAARQAEPVAAVAAT